MITGNGPSHDEIRLRVAQNIRRVRNNRGFTQEELAHRARLASRHLQKIEAAQVNITLETLVKLARALNIDPVEFFHKPPQEGKC
ncbi:helix-turn-helix transcriptional regulator [Coprothermobacteraceae bacterium]|nr:helix-turn-helix transcriptional regulator [Coprothermobacteraceae bacterium]